MRNLCIFFIIHVVLKNGVLCASGRTTESNDAIYFMPDDLTQTQVRPISAEEIQYYLQMQAANKYPPQNNGNIGVNQPYQPQNNGNIGVNQQYQLQYSPTVQPLRPVHSLNTHYYTTNNDKGVTDQYTLHSERPVQSNIDQYPSTNKPVATYEEKLHLDEGTQASILPSQSVNVSGAIAQFGLDILQITDQQNNVVISPYSINTLLAVLQQGAVGETQQQISSVLQMPVAVAAKEYKQLTNALNRRDVRHNILKVANGAFVSNTFNLNSNFKSKAIDNFACEITPLDFFDSYGATQKINKWVSNATNNKIDQLLSPGSVGANTQLVLVNALLFKGVWEMKFRAESTLPRDFNVVGLGRKRVDFLRARRYYRYGEDKASHLQVIVLPFEKQEYSLIVLLPSQKSTVAEVLRSITYAKLAEYLKNAPQDVDLELPKFSVRSDIDLKPLLREMGVTKIFDSTAELFGVIDGGHNSPQVSSAVHSAMLSIDEEGGTAAAATAFTVVALSYSSPDAVFKADRPFLAVLWDTKQALPLIMAKITDPTM